MRRPTVIGVLLLLATGCHEGLPLGDVSGRVTLDGVPVTGGVVIFVPQQGPQALGKLDESGQYRLTTPGAGSGAVVGQHTVFLTPDYDTTPLAGYSSEDELQGVPPPRLPSLLRPELPEKWLSLSSTDLKAQVTSGNNRQDWNLAEPGNR